ncbi:MAG: phosphatase PAP2 family protein [Saprospiraceae bacterium]
MNYQTQHIKILFLAALAATLLTWSACKKSGTAINSPYALVQSNTAEVPLAWMELFLELDRYAPDYRPGPAARALAYTNFAAYESCMAGMPGFTSLQTLYSGLSLPATDPAKDYHWPTVVNAVYASLTKHFFPSEALAGEQETDLQFKILELEEAFNSDFLAKVGSGIFNRSKTHGEAVADAIWEWSKTDPFGHNAYLFPRPDTYTPPEGPGLWAPTSPQFEDALFPFWGKVRTFAISQQEKLSQPPLSFSQESTSQLYAQALTVRNAVANPTFTEEWIAEFWSDDIAGQTFSPAARWISITNQVIANEDSNLETALYAYTKVSFALHDAAVATGHSKYIYNVERPVSYINRVIDSGWQPHWNSTPSYPSYPSSHAAFGAAATEALSHIFGYSYAATDRSHEGRDDFYGMPRSFESFYEMAEENAQSRLYLGMNYGMDIAEGLRMGFDIGRAVNDLPFKR